MELDPDIAALYTAVDEQVRLQADARGQIEFVRTMTILERTLPASPVRILDVGGGPGRYAAALAAQGHRVTLMDPVEKHIEEADRVSEQMPHGFDAQLGDARKLDASDATVDAVLLLGPLYHLNEHDRALSLAQALRVLRPGGVLMAAAISRFASLLDGLREGWLADEDFAAVVKQDLQTGQHTNPDPVGRPEWFTTAWLHRPDQLRTEVAEAGFAVDAILAVEGPLALLADLDEWWSDQDARDRLLSAAETVEREPSLLGVSPHLLAVPHNRHDRSGERYVPRRPRESQRSFAVASAPSSQRRQVHNCSGISGYRDSRL